MSEDYIYCADCLYGASCSYYALPRVLRIIFGEDDCGIKTIDAQLRELEEGGVWSSGRSP